MNSRQWQLSHWRGGACAARSMPFERALSLLEGDEETAREALNKLEQLRTGGSRVVVRKPRASTKANPFSPTNLNLGVLDLLDKAMCNKELARRFSISPKIVDHHVSAILGKLEAKSRSEAPAIARGEPFIHGGRGAFSLARSRAAVQSRIESRAITSSS